MARPGAKKYEEESEDEYEVERIESHKLVYKGKQKKPELMYLIKWKNYPSTDNTWEPSMAVDNAEDLVDEYWVTKGGQQKREDVFLEIKDFKPSQGSRPPAKKSSESTSQAKKRKEDTLSESSPAKKKKKQNEPETEDEYESDTYSTYSSEDEPDYSESDLEDETFRQKSNWKDVSKVETVRLGNDKKTLYAIVRWSDGKVAKYQTSVVGKKNPMALIHYYEKRLSFEKNT